MKISNSMERYIKCQLMEVIKDVSPRDVDMMSFPLNLLIFNLVKEAKWSTNYISDLTNFFKIMVCLGINYYFVKKKFNLF